MPFPPTLTKAHQAFVPFQDTRPTPRDGPNHVVQDLVLSERSMQLYCKRLSRHEPRGPVHCNYCQQILSGPQRPGHLLSILNIVAQPSGTRMMKINLSLMVLFISGGRCRPSAYYIAIFVRDHFQTTAESTTPILDQMAHSTLD